MDEPSRHGSRRWRWLLAQAGALSLAAVGAIALYGNRAELAAQLGRLALVALPVAALGCGVMLKRSWRRPMVVPVALIAGVLASLAVQDARQDLARHLAQLATFWVPLALVAGLPWLLRRWKQLLLLLAGLGVALLAVHAAGPTLVDRFAMPLYELDGDHRPKPQPGWRNTDGVSPDTPPADYRDEDYVVVFLGDSFTEGLYLDDWRDAFPFVVQERLQAARPDAGVRVVNFGWTGSSPVLQERQLRELGRRYRPDLVVQCFDMTDFHDDLRYVEMLEDKGLDARLELSVWRMLEIWASWALGVADLRVWLADRAPWESGSTDAASVAGRLGRFFPLELPLASAEPHMEVSWSAIQRTAAAAERLGADYALVVLPRYQQFDPTECPDDWERDGFARSGGRWLLQPFSWFEARATQADFPVWPLLEAFVADPRKPKVFPNDPHYNPTGHEIAGEAVVERLLAGGAVD